MNCTPLPAAPLVKRYSFIFPPENELMLFKIDPLPRFTFVRTRKREEPPPPIRGRGLIFAISPHKLLRGWGSALNSISNFRTCGNLIYLLAKGRAGRVFF